MWYVRNLATNRIADSLGIVRSSWSRRRLKKLPVFFSRQSRVVNVTGIPDCCVSKIVIVRVGRWRRRRNKKRSDGNGWSALQTWAFVNNASCLSADNANRYCTRCRLASAVYYYESSWRIMVFALLRAQHRRLSMENVRPLKNSHYCAQLCATKDKGANESYSYTYTFPRFMLFANLYTSSTSRDSISVGCIVST